MKSILLLIFLFINGILMAQECEYSSNVKDSIGLYKSTKDYLMHEKVFGNKISLIYFSLINTDGMPSLNVQFIEKSNDFMKVNCFNKNSRLYFQLENGKIITLTHVDENNCGNAVRDEKGKNNRILSGFFEFLPNTLADLKSSPIAIMRVKYDIDAKDYIIKNNFISEIDKNKYNSSTYFITYLRCVE